MHAKASAFMEGQDTDILSFGKNCFESIYKDHNLVLNTFQLRQAVKENFS